MSSEVVVYGASDDLIEVEGALREEFSDPDFSGGAYVYASTGDIIRFRLEDEGWRATVVFDASSPVIEHVGDYGEVDDRVTLSGAAWVVATTVEPVVRRG
jgi:hypothetical protein